MCIPGMADKQQHIYQTRSFVPKVSLKVMMVSRIQWDKHCLKIIWWELEVENFTLKNIFKNRKSTMVPGL